MVTRKHLSQARTTKGQFQYPSGVDFDMPQRKVKVKQITVTSKAKLLGVLWIVRQSTCVQKRAFHTSHPGSSCVSIASSCVSAANQPHRVTVRPVMRW